MNMSDLHEARFKKRRRKFSSWSKFGFSEKRRNKTFTAAVIVMMKSTHMSVEPRSDPPLGQVRDGPAEVPS